MTDAALDLSARADARPAIAREPREPLEPAVDPGDRAERISVFTRVLRGLGAVLVVAAGSTFMLQHWSEGDNVVRYLTLLGMSLGLSGAGIFCGIGVKENRSARTLLGLVLTLVPVHFTVLGALLRSQFSIDGVFNPNAPWAADSPEAAMMLAGLGLAVVAALSLLAMLVMVRPHARRLTLALIAMHAPLLLPVRDPMLIAWIVAAMVALTVIVERRIVGLGYAMRTPEGRFVRALMAVPVLLVTGRTALWYDPGLFFLGMGTMSAGLGLYWLSAQVFQNEERVQALQALFGITSVLGMLLVAAETVHALAVPVEVAALVFALPAAAMLLAMASTCVGSGTAYRSLAAIVAVGTSLANALVHWHTGPLSFAGIACLMVGLASLGAGILYRKRLPTMLGAAGSIAGFVQVVVAAVEFEHLAHWGSLTAIGVALIFIAALFERHATRLMAMARAMHAEQAGWEL